MGYLMIKVEVPSMDSSQLNAKIEDDSKPHEGVIQVRNLMEAILAGAIDAEVSVASRDSDQAISVDGSGIDASYNLK